MLRPLQPGVFGHATFELDYRGFRVGRIRLDRWWEPSLDLASGRPCGPRYRPLVFIGVNPSEADGEGDDNTVVKMISFARREGANGLVMVNVHTGISKKPRELCNVLLPEGATARGWEAVVAALCENAVAYVAGWGKPPRGLSSYQERVAQVKKIAARFERPLVCFGMNLDGSPTHPLYLPGSTPLVPWTT